MTKQKNAMMNFLCIYYATVFKAILLAMSAYLLSLFSWKKITTEKRISTFMKILAKTT